MGGHAGRVGCLDWNAHVLSRWVTLETFISTAALFRLLLLHMIIDHSLSTSSSLSSANVNLQLYFSTKLCSSGAVPHPPRNFPTKLNPPFCSSGSRTGGIHHHDVRVATHHVATLANHLQEVCGLRWSPDGQYLASGGNDNAVNVWDSTLGMEVAPLHTFTEHQAAVKVKAVASLV